MKYYVVITPFFPSENSFRGPFIYDQVCALISLTDYNVIVIKVGRNDIDKCYEFEGVLVHQIELKDLPSNILPGLFMNHNISKILNLLKKLTNKKLNNIEVIHGHSAYSAGVLASAIANKIGTQSIVQHHGFDVMGYKNGRVKNKLFKKFNNYWINKIHVNYLNQATWNVGVSQKTIEKLNEVPGYQKTKEFILYNGVNQEAFYPIEGLRDEKYFTIGCIGNFWSLKDQITLIKAVELLIKRNINDLRVKFIGTGATLSECKRYVNKYNLDKHIIFKDEVPHKELVRFYNSLDLFVLPSYWEAIGCVYTEAFNCGVPFIGVFGQGIEEIIPPCDKTLFLIEKGDYKNLSDLILFHKINRVKQNILIDSNIEVLISKFLKVIMC